MSLFGVYDGHGGHEVAEWISKKFPDILKKEIEEEKIDLNEAFGKRIQEIFVKTGIFYFGRTWPMKIRVDVPRYIARHTWTGLVYRSLYNLD